jgi:hypothetical protein
VKNRRSSIQAWAHPAWVIRRLRGFGGDGF